jgi:alpha-L-fucosidase
MDLINQVSSPTFVYFDDTALPLWPVSDAGLKLAAGHYNRRAKGLPKPAERATAVLFGKVLDERAAPLSWCGTSSAGSAQPHRARSRGRPDTCIGGWHYDRGVEYDRNRVQVGGKTVVRTCSPMW